MGPILAVGKAADQCRNAVMEGGSTSNRGRLNLESRAVRREEEGRKRGRGRPI
jgi:hypothetical protein